MSNPFMQYKQQAISTMSGGELITSLFDGVIKNLNLAITLYDKGDNKVAAVCTEKCKRIFDHLILSLDFKIPVSNELFKLYNFFKQEIVAAEIKLKSEPLSEILPLITDLKNTWAEASKLSHIAKG